MSEILAGYTLHRDDVIRKGPTVDELLNKIEDLQNATHSVAGTMSAEDKIKLDELEDDEALSWTDISGIIESEYLG